MMQYQIFISADWARVTCRNFTASLKTKLLNSFLLKWLHFITITQELPI